MAPPSNTVPSNGLPASFANSCTISAAGPASPTSKPASSTAASPSCFIIRTTHAAPKGLRSRGSGPGRGYGETNVSGAIRIAAFGAMARTVLT